MLPADAGNQDLLEGVAGHLERGGLLGYPTETVYGLGGRVDRDRIAALRALKGRGEDKPFLLLVPTVAGIAESGLEWSASSARLAEAFWPGPLTLVLRDPEGRHPQGVRGPSGGVAVRLSPAPFVRALMEVWRKPLLSTSANPAGTAPARTAAGVRDSLLDRADVSRLWIMDGGPQPGSEPSTLVDCIGPRPGLLRRGAIPLEVLRDVLPELEDRSSPSGTLP